MVCPTNIRQVVVMLARQQEAVVRPGPTQTTRQLHRPLSLDSSERVPQHRHQRRLPTIWAPPIRCPCLVLLQPRDRVMEPAKYPLHLVRLPTTPKHLLRRLHLVRIKQRRLQHRVSGEHHPQPQLLRPHLPCLVHQLKRPVKLASVQVQLQRTLLLVP